MKLSIVVPAFNEEKNIPSLIEAFAKVFKMHNDIQIIFVENGSDDNSKQVFIEELEKYKNYNFKIVFLGKNKGYGHGIKSGLKASEADYVGWTHADMQTNPKDILKSLSYLENGKKVFIKGYRRGRSLSENFFSFFMGVFETILFQKLIYEINAQPTIFHRSLLDDFEEMPDDFSIDLFSYITAKKKNFIFKRIRVNFPKRIHGESSWNRGLEDVLKFSIRTIRYSIKLRFNDNN